jgi:hypothetical protein
LLAGLTARRAGKTAINTRRCGTGFVGTDLRRLDVPALADERFAIASVGRIGAGVGTGGDRGNGGNLIIVVCR